MTTKTKSVACIMMITTLIAGLLAWDYHESEKELTKIAKRAGETHKAQIQHLNDDAVWGFKKGN